MALSKARQEYYKKAYFDINNCDSVTGFYKKPSEKKLAAERRILFRMRTYGGYGYKVISGNCYNFVAMWRTQTQFVVETYASAYFIKI